MRLVFLVIIAIAASYALFSVIDIYPDNYVKIYVDSYLLEMSFTGFLFLLIFLVALLYLGFWLVGSSFRVSTLFSRWRKRRNVKKAGEALGSGYLALIKGDWRKAEKSLLARTDNSSVPYVNYLAAAQAAQEQGKLSRRDEYLVSAYKAAPEEEFAIGLAKARLHYLAGQHQQAQATLNDIERDGRKNSQFVAMRLQNAQSMHDWEQVHDFLPIARKLKALPESVLEEIDTQAHRALLVNSDNLDATWRSLPDGQKQHIDNILTYVNGLVSNGKHAEAEKLLRGAFKHQYDDAMVELYGNLQTDKPAKLRRAVDGWLMARPESAHLNLAAGRLALKEKNTELAIEYLEKAIELGRLPGAYAELGQLLESENESGRALQLYRSALANMSSTTGELALAQLDEQNSKTAGLEPEVIKKGEVI